ncbi:MAG: 2OG-Fe(II) oxygenase [Halothiobacillaceae bacterium]
MNAPLNDRLNDLAHRIADANPPSSELVEPAWNNPPIDFSQLVEGLAGPGWFVAAQYLPEALCQGLRAELDQLSRQSALEPAGVGRGQAHRQAETIRGDHTHWLDGSTAVQGAYLAIMRALKDSLNRALFMGLFEYECHYALYPPGAFYKRHLDSFRGRANRIVTTVLYLNPDWQPDDAGCMRLYAPQGDGVLMDVPPRMGTFVAFLSEHIPHEVLPTQADRASIAGWFRCNATLGGLVDPAR